MVNNDYSHGWGIYAIGGGANPTINSQGNRFIADPNRYPYSNEVTRRTSGGESEWKNWNWRSEGDLFFNGAYFVPSGATGADSAAYAKASSYSGAKTSSMVGAITSAAGALTCRKGHMCH